MMLKFNEDYGTDTSDIDGMVDAVLDFVYTYDFNDACDSDSIDSDTGEFTEDAIEETKEMLIDKDERLADYLNDIIDTLSPDERYDGKIDDIIDYLRGWDNKGGKKSAMSSKNESVNTSDFDKWCLKNVAPKVKEEIAKIKKQIKSGAIDTDDIDGIVSAVATNVFNLVTDAVAPYVEKKQTNEAYDYDYVNTITADQMDDAVEEGYPVKVVISGEYYDYQSTRGMHESLDESEEEEADDDFVDGEEKTDDNMNESLAGFKRLPVKSFVSEFSNASDNMQTPAQIEDEVADESFAHDDSM